MNRAIPLNQKRTPTLYINKPDFGSGNDKNANANLNAVKSQANLNAEKDDDDDEEGHIGSKETNKSEGEKLFAKKEYRKAIDCFTMALEMDLKNPDPKCLVWRSRCWLRLGRNEEALADAESSLLSSQDNIHGLLIKAQVLFQIGDFEFALVQFHRGHKLRPELELFTKGIQCCEEVITNCVGDSDHKLTLEGDLSFLDRVHPQIHFMDEEEKKKKENLNKSQNRNANANTNAGRGSSDSNNRRSTGTGAVSDGRRLTSGADFNNNNEDEYDADTLDPLDAVAAANAENPDNEATSAAAAAAAASAGNNTNNFGGVDVRDGVLGAQSSQPSHAESKKASGATLPAFIYEDAAYNADNAAEEEDGDAASVDGARTPRFKTEAAVRAAIDDSASVASEDLRDGDYNVNANANANAVGGGRGTRVIVPEARQNMNANMHANMHAIMHANMNANNCGICKRPPRQEKTKDEEGVRKWRQPKTCKMLLGELYKDRVYLESLLNDGDLIDPNYPVHKTTKREITKAINYLDSKADYWQRYKPIYARIGDKGQDKKRATGEELALQIQRSLEEIDQAHNDNRWEDCLSKARLLLANSSKWSPADIVNKRVVISALHNYMGVSYTELRRFDRGLREHIMDFEDVSKEPVLLDNKSRALENMGKVYAKMGNYTKALISWQQKEPLCKSDYENAWVCHEIGRAYLEMGNFARSRQSAVKAYKFAVSCDDKLWMLHSSVLQAQTEAKMGELQAAYDTFGVALNHANQTDDDLAAPAIRRALKDIKLRLVRRGRGTSTATAAAGEDEGEEEEEGDGNEERAANEEEILDEVTVGGDGGADDDGANDNKDEAGDNDNKDADEAGANDNKDADEAGANDNQITKEDDDSADNGNRTEDAANDDVENDEAVNSLADASSNEN